MNRNEFLSYVEDSFGVGYDCPFEDDLDTWVFRHPDNRKWFALVMRIKGHHIGIEGCEHVEVVNLKCAPEIMDDLWKLPGVFPAYHMNKKHWLTLALDGSCDCETIEWITRLSFDLTRKTIKRK